MQGSFVLRGMSTAPWLKLPATSQTPAWMVGRK
ncbi:hypothetical protein GCK32_021053 [Trichostrongylus colubriformis]|uniref:Uncharacterized protein n=1 Tax=Trichostrongylus colubriformis TaxID=6319 RepID=A0AAN8J1Y8_TRICO